MHCYEAVYCAYDGILRTAKNVVRNAGMSRSFYFIKY